MKKINTMKNKIDSNKEKQIVIANNIKALGNQLSDVRIRRSSNAARRMYTPTENTKQYQELESERKNIESNNNVSYVLGSAFHKQGGLLFAHQYREEQQKKLDEIDNKMKELRSKPDVSSFLRASRHEVDYSHIDSIDTLEKKIKKERIKLAKIEIEQIKLIDNYVEAMKEKGLKTIYQFNSIFEDVEFFSNPENLKEYNDNMAHNSSIYNQLGMIHLVKSRSIHPFESELHTYEGLTSDIKWTIENAYRRKESRLFNEIKGYDKQRDEQIVNSLRPVRDKYNKIRISLSIKERREAEERMRLYEQERKEKEKQKTINNQSRSR